MRIVFRARCDCGPSEELFLVGGSAKLGEWNPARAVRLTKIQADVYQVVLAGISELDKVIEYKYLLRDSRQPGYVKWDKGRNRFFECTSDEVGVVLDERPFQNGTSEWCAYNSEEESTEDHEWGNYEYLKRKQSFWELWERPPAVTTKKAIRQKQNPSKEQIIDSPMSDEGSSSQGHSPAEEVILGEKLHGISEDEISCRTKPKPFWMLHRNEAEQFEGSSPLQSNLKIISSQSRYVCELTIDEDGVTPLERPQREYYIHREEEYLSRMRLQPSTLYRSRNLPTYLLWRKPENRTYVDVKH